MCPIRGFDSRRLHEVTLLSVAEVAASGDERATLEAMRDRLAQAMDEAPDAVVAQVAGRLQHVLARLAELGAPKKETLTDVLAERRAARAGAQSSG